MALAVSCDSPIRAITDLLPHDPGQFLADGYLRKAALNLAVRLALAYLIAAAKSVVAGFDTTTVDVSEKKE